MSTSNGSLRITATASTEVRVIDGQLNKVMLPAGNAGSMVVDLPTGVYQVAFRAGNAWKEAAPVYVGAGGEQKVDEPAELRATAVDDDPEPPASASVFVTVHDPNEGLEARLTAVGSAGGSGPPGTSVAVPGGLGLGFDLRPGYWRLRLVVEALVLEMPVVVCPGWVTRVAIATRPGDEDWRKRPDLASIAVRMRRVGGGSPDDAEGDLRLERDALATLATGRDLHGTAFNGLVRQLLGRKQFNPMLGLYAGHMIPGTTDDDKKLLALVVSHLTSLFGRSLPLAGGEHPDVSALRLKLARLGGDADAPSRIPLPPTLFAGWLEVVRAAEAAPLVVPAGSLTDRAAARLWGSGPWVVWTGPLDDAPAADPGFESTRAMNVNEVPFDEARCTIRAGLHHSELREWFRTADLSPEERIVGQAIRPVTETATRQAVFDQLSARSRASRRAPETVGELAQALGLPTGTVARAVGRLAARMSEQSDHIHLNLRARTEMARPELIIPYDPRFLGDGFEVPLPGLTAALRAGTFGDGTVLHYTHYSLVMHTARRVAAYTAHNVDAAQAVRGIGGGLTWKMDERVGGDGQLGNETYVNNRLDKGHLVRRQDVIWGPVAEARAANKATFFYTNAAPQHENFNQDEWVELEDWVLHDATDLSYRLCVFTGPVLRPDDPTLDDLPPGLRDAFNARRAQIPAAFWKVVVLRDSRAGGDDLSAVAFAMKQTEMWNDREGRRLLNLRVHQVTLAAIEGWTGLDFGPLRDVDELEWSPSSDRARELGQEPAWPVVRSAADITYTGASRRARGLRAGRVAGRTAVMSADRAASGCGCGAAPFDARAAIEALSHDLARLTDAVATLNAPRADGARGDGARVGGGVEMSPQVKQRVEDVVAAAPDALKDTVRKFSQDAALATEVTAGRMPAPSATVATRIVGGFPVPTGQFPSCCCIGDAGGWFCTGVVVAPQVVLTAAHCGHGITRVMVAGNRVTPFRDAEARDVAVRRVEVHPSYRAHPYNENDITVLILSTPANVTPTRLATDTELAAVQEVDLVGFGYNDPNQAIGFGTKRQVTAGLLALPANGDLGNLPTTLGFHPAYEIVAGRKGLGRDTCNGDSGGPAYVRLAAGGHAVAGLTSRATRTATVNCGDGGIYVRPAAFRDWINGVLSAAGLPPLT